MNVLDMFRLDGKVALVTGVGRGIGQGMALALAEAGADIAGVYNTRYEETQSQITGLGRRFLPIKLDMLEATAQQYSDVVDQVVKEYGRLDILVNNAGIVRRTPAVDYSEADWNAVLQVNLNTVFFLSQAAARVMLKRGSGKIIQVASLLSLQGGIYVPPYAASKHAVAGLTKAFANEWSSQGINVNAIAPGYIETDNNTALRADPVRYPAITDRIPMGRWGQVDDMKGITVFLASAASDYVHGSIITVDGGWMGR
jgi:2-deoxy-D-gluconate 3-dehydrogenase